MNITIISYLRTQKSSRKNIQSKTYNTIFKPIILCFAIMVLFQSISETSEPIKSHILHIFYPLKNILHTNRTFPIMCSINMRCPLTCNCMVSTRNSITTGKGKRRQKTHTSNHYIPITYKYCKTLS